MLTMIKWETVKEDFKWDGSLRDIYVSPATLDDRQTTYPFLRDRPNVEFSLDGGFCDAPRNIDALFFSDPRPRLRFRIGRALAVFQFFTPDEIDCDIDPREVTSQTDLHALLDFVREIGGRTCKRVVVTPENMREEPFIEYAPEAKSFQYFKSCLKPS